MIEIKIWAVGPWTTIVIILTDDVAVSYTHLDVYKRQILNRPTSQP